MPIQTTQEEKRETTVVKISNGRLKTIEPFTRGREKYVADASLVCDHYNGQSGRDVKTVGLQPLYIPVIDMNQKPLMPTIPARARRWIESGKATPFWKRGIFCVRLNTEPSSRNSQEVAVGIDPGSKKEGFTIKSEAHTFLNIQADAVTWVKNAIEVRKNMRRARRYRKTPYRSPRYNRARNCLPSSTRARWGWKLRIVNWLSKLYPISHFVVEDIKARTTGQRRWDASFSPLEVGKTWFYDELRKIAPLDTNNGWETKEMRDAAGLKKNKNKMTFSFDSHCVDSWLMANSWTGGHTQPDNKNLICLTPLQFHRRQLHFLQPSRGGIRKNYGSTKSMDFKRGSLVKHQKWGIVYVGGTSKNKITLHSLSDGKRLSRDVNPHDCKFLTYNSWRCSV